MAITVRRLGATIGAEVVGADLNALDDVGFKTIHEALLDHSVIAIRDQHLTPASHVAFTRRFGEADNHIAAQFNMPEQPEILLLSNRRQADGSPVGFEEAGRYWHSDVSYAERPVLGSLLYAVEIPPTGGDTLFADMYMAYDALPEEVRRRISGLRAMHSYGASFTGKTSRTFMSPEQLAALGEVSHPVVRTHPETGREALYVNPGFTTRFDGMDADESRPLLTELFKQSTRPEMIYRHVWKPRDLLFWDNRCTMHHATPYDPSFTRHMHRTTVRGDVPV